MSVAVTAPTQRALNPGAPGSRERVELILGHLDRLPALPTAVARLLAVTTSEESSAKDVVTVIESDASLTAGILRMVRRAHLGVHERTMTVSRAVTLLGFRTVRNAALSSRFFEALTPEQSDTATAAIRRGLWEHSLGVACAAELIAERMSGAKQAGEAFVCGLLHDIGKIALDVCLPKSYSRTAEYAERRGECICDVEREVFGLDHTVAGKRLVSRWQLPQAIMECVWLHHQNPKDLPSTLSDPQLVKIVHLADDVIRREGIGFSGYQPRHAGGGDVDVLGRDLGLEPDAVAVVCEQLPERMKPFRVLLGLGEGDEPVETGDSLVAVNRRLGDINSQLMEANCKLSFRSACFEALGRFTTTVSEDDRVADVCAAAAEAVALLFDAQQSVAFVSQPTSRVVHAGWYDASSERRSTMVVDFGSASVTVPGWGGGSAAAADAPSEDTRNSPARSRFSSGAREASGLQRAPEQCDRLWEKTTGLAVDGPLWILPWGEEGGCGVMFVAEENRVTACRTYTEDCAVLARAFDLAIGSARGRVDAELMTEELLDLNRRCRSAEKELVRTRSISMVAEMAAGAAHELNNPLAVISGRAQMEMEYALDPERIRAMEIIIGQTQKASQIVLDLMSFAKPEPPQPTLQSVTGVFEQLSQYWGEASSLPADRLFLGECDAELTVFADAEQLREILVSVLGNAIGACDPQQGRVQVNLGSPASDEMVRIVVEDNGAGMSPEVLEHAFDPFFSSRPAGRGRGLGLSRAYRLAEINGGRLWIESTQNVGTTVTIELPSRAPAA